MGTSDFFYYISILSLPCVLLVTKCCYGVDMEKRRHDAFGKVPLPRSIQEACYTSGYQKYFTIEQEFQTCSSILSIWNALNAIKDNEMCLASVVSHMSDLYRNGAADRCKCHGGTYHLSFHHISDDKFECYYSYPATKMLYDLYTDLPWQHSQVGHQCQSHHGIWTQLSALYKIQGYSCLKDFIRHMFLSAGEVQDTCQCNDGGAFPVSTMTTLSSTTITQSSAPPVVQTTLCRECADYFHLNCSSYKFTPCAGSCMIQKYKANVEMRCVDVQMCHAQKIDDQLLPDLNTTCCTNTNCTINTLQDLLDHQHTPIFFSQTTTTTVSATQTKATTTADVTSAWPMIIG